MPLDVSALTLILGGTAHLLVISKIKGRLSISIRVGVGVATVLVGLALYLANAFIYGSV